MMVHVRETGDDELPLPVDRRCARRHRDRAARAGLPDPRSVDDDDGILNRRTHRAVDERGAGDDRHAGLLCLRDEARERKADHQWKSKAFHTSSPMQTMAVRY